MTSPFPPEDDESGMDSLRPRFHTLSEEDPMESVKSLLEAACDGPWEAYDPGDGTARLYGDVDPEDDDSGIRLFHVVDDHGYVAGVYMNKEDGELAAAAPEMAQWLLRIDEVAEKARLMRTIHHTHGWNSHDDFKRDALALVDELLEALEEPDEEKPLTLF